jgi:hypothetical protein
VRFGFKDPPDENPTPFNNLLHVLSMKTKQQFLASPKRAKLSKKEQDKRWAQYVASNRNSRKAPVRHSVNHKGKTVLKLSPCAREYMGALQYPFSTKALACVPDMHALPSRKVRVVERGTFATGLNGFGWLVAAPWVTAKDLPCLSATSAGYNGVAQISDPNVVTANVINNFQAKMPYTSNQFYATTTDPGIEARVVGAGLRVRYIGSEMARSGQIAALRHPDNESLVGFDDRRFRSYEHCKVFPNNREWSYVTYRPAKPNEYEYSRDPESAGDSNNYKFNLGFHITGTTNSTGTPGSAPFEFQFVQFVEYLGKIEGVTRSHVDLPGLSHIRNSLPESSAYNNPSKNALKTSKQLVSSMRDVAEVNPFGDFIHN